MSSVGIVNTNFIPTQPAKTPVSKVST